MNEIKAFEQAIQSNNMARVNVKLLRAYYWSKDAGNELVTFNDIIWDYEIPEIAEQLKEHDINEFAISSTASSLIATLALFEQNGYKVAGLVKVLTDRTDWKTGAQVEADAIKMIKE